MFGGVGICTEQSEGVCSRVGKSLRATVAMPSKCSLPESSCVHHDGNSSLSLCDICVLDFLKLVFLTQEALEPKPLGARMSMCEWWKAYGVCLPDST